MLNLPFSVLPKEGYLNDQYQIDLVTEDPIEFQLYRQNILIRSFAADSANMINLHDLEEPGEYVLHGIHLGNSFEQRFFIHDAIRLGSSEVKFVRSFDHINYSTIVMKDRLFLYDEKKGRVEISWKD